MSCALVIQLLGLIALHAQDDLKESILHFVTSLALANPEAAETLTKSNILIPSIIAYLTDITSPMWEDDEALVASPSRVDWYAPFSYLTSVLLTAGIGCCK